ncbi:MAG: polysaccharide deacetylase [Candidatus Competibacterales bacterium]
MTTASPQPPSYRWPAGKRCAAVFSADVDGESPYLWTHRHNPPGVVGELEQRRYGPRVGIYRLLALLDDFQLKGSLYVPGHTAQRFPALLPHCAERGHEIGCHGFLHERVDELSAGENRRVLDRCSALFEQQLGIQPRGYRSPSWEITLDLWQLLQSYGFLYDSSLMGYDHPYSLEGLVEVPVQWLTDDAIYFRYTSGPRDKGPPVNPKQVLESWIEEFEGLRAVGGLLMITVHPWISGRPQRLRMLRRLLEHIRQHDDVWWATAAEVAHYHATSENLNAFDQPLELASH